MALDALPGDLTWRVEYQSSVQVNDSIYGDIERPIDPYLVIECGWNVWSSANQPYFPDGAFLEVKGNFTWFPRDIHDHNLQRSSKTAHLVLNECAWTLNGDTGLWEGRISVPDMDNPGSADISAPERNYTFISPAALTPAAGAIFIGYLTESYTDLTEWPRDFTDNTKRKNYGLSTGRSGTQFLPTYAIAKQWAAYPGFLGEGFYSKVALSSNDPSYPPFFLTSGAGAFDATGRNIPDQMLLGGNYGGYYTPNYGRPSGADNYWYGVVQGFSLVSQTDSYRRWEKPDAVNGTNYVEMTFSGKIESWSDYLISLFQDSYYFSDSALVASSFTIGDSWYIVNPSFNGGITPHGTFTRSNSFLRLYLGSETATYRVLILDTDGTLQQTSLAPTETTPQSPGTSSYWTYQLPDKWIISVLSGSSENMPASGTTGFDNPIIPTVRALLPVD